MTNELIRYDNLDFAYWAGFFSLQPGFNAF